MTVSERIQYIYNAARKAGITHQGTIGLLGNLQGETSDFNPMSLETMYANRFHLTDEQYTKKADNDEFTYNTKTFEFDSAGYGIAQWTWWSRKRKLLEFAEDMGKSVGDLEVQVKFMFEEMQSSYPETWNVLTTTDDYREAVNICVTEYEKPADMAGAIEKRNAYAKALLNQIADTYTDTHTDIEEEIVVKHVSTDEAIAALIATARAELGYLEKRSLSQLEDKTANAGSNNYTKYAQEIDTKYPRFYNGKKNGFAWCDVFVDWCFIKTFGYETAMKLLCAPERSSGAGCIESARYYRNVGRHYRDPKVGDQIFFGGGNGYETHTGIVVAVTATSVTTIEGNTSAGAAVIPNGGGVHEKTYARNHYYITGYGRPDYSLVTEVIAAPDKPLEAETEKPNDEVTEKPAATVVDEVEKDVDEDVKVALKTLKNGATGTQVESMQALLVEKYDISCGSAGADGDFGPNTLEAVRAFQKRRGLAVDGICGQNTWTALLAG